MDGEESRNAETLDRLRRAAELPRPSWSDPSPTVWAEVVAQLGEGIGGEPGALGPDVGSRSGAEPPAMSRPAATSSGVTRRIVLAGIGGLAAGAVLGGVGTVLWIDSQKRSGTIIGQAELTPLDQPDRVLGHAELLRDRAGVKLVVSVPKGLSNDDGYIEVWLINLDLKRMVSVGVFSGGDTVWFRIDDSFIAAGYTIVDLSREKFDDEPRHSGDTLMRGPLVL